MSELQEAVATVVERCLGVKKGEDVVVLTDPPKRAIGDALVGYARELGAEAVLVEMAERETHGTEPPRVVASAIARADVFIAPTSKSVSHTRARKEATAKGVRAATMPDITEDMLARTMSADYEEIGRRSKAIAEALTDASEVRITTAAGTDVVIGVEGRTGLADTGDLTTPGAFGNLPAGEAFVAPVEGTTRGRIFFDGSIWPVGKLGSPLEAEIVEGYAVELSGEAAERFRATIEPYGRDAFAVAELGIGTNPAARLTGNILEDEKILGTIHVAFGNNATIGGTIDVPSHQDGVVLQPTVYLDGAKIIDDGRLLV